MHVNAQFGILDFILVVDFVYVHKPVISQVQVGKNSKNTHLVFFFMSSQVNLNFTPSKF
jgi:hypothetical protein